MREVRCRWLLVPATVALAVPCPWLLVTLVVRAGLVDQRRSRQAAGQLVVQWHSPAVWALMGAVAMSVSAQARARAVVRTAQAGSFSLQAIRRAVRVPEVCRLLRVQVRTVRAAQFAWSAVRAHRHPAVSCPSRPVLAAPAAACRCAQAHLLQGLVVPWCSKAEPPLVDTAVLSASAWVQAAADAVALCRCRLARPRTVLVVAAVCRLPLAVEVRLAAMCRCMAALAVQRGQLEGLCHLSVAKALRRAVDRLQLALRRQAAAARVAK